MSVANYLTVGGAISPAAISGKVRRRRSKASTDYLTAAQVEQLMKVAQRSGRWGHRNSTPRWPANVAGDGNV
jgi:hypothetical protein